MTNTTTGWALALALAAALPIGAGEAGDPPKKAKSDKAERAAKRGGAGKVDPAADAGALTDEQLDAKLRATARAAFVTVHVTFRKDPAEMQGPSPYHDRNEARGPEDAARELAHRFVDDERPLDLPGLWLDAAGTVLVTDLGLPLKLVERIEVRTGDGKAYPATPKALLRDAPGWLLAAALPAGMKAPAPAFAEPGPVGPATELTAAWIEEVDGVWSLALGTVGGATQPLSGANGPSWLVVGDGSSAGASLRPPGPWGGIGMSDLSARPFHLLFDEEAAPVGVALHDRLPVAADGPLAWRGPAIPGGAAVPFAALEALERRLVEAAGRQVAEVKLTFRMDAPEEESDAFARFRSFHGSGADDERGREMTAYGIAVAPRRLLVPAELGVAVAARIERIDVALPGRAPVPGRFLGAYKAFAAFLVETAEPLAEPPADLFAVASIPRTRPVPTLRVIRKYGRRTEVFGTARILELQRGYKHALHPVADPPQAPGTLLFDLDGRPAGFVARLRRDDEKVRALRDPDHGGYSSPWETGMTAEDNRLLLFRDLRAALETPATALDPDIRVKTKFEERRLVWLGVETCALNRELTRQLGVEGPTKSGQVGAMVVDVYDGSPAQRIGLKDGDLLLTVREKDGKEPVELRFNDSERGRSRGRFRGEGPSPESEEELWLAEPPWHSQRNPLNLLLTSLGKGRTVLLSVLADGKVTEKELVLEEGPPDYESADRRKHEPTGLTARDLTSEARRALKLPSDAPGVVVSKVEEGSPAAVARIHPYDVIQRIEGTAATGAAELVKALDAARAAGSASVKVQTLRLNRTRFVDLRFDADAGDEKPGKAGAPDK
jgi:hypothetical protein